MALDFDWPKIRDAYDAMAAVLEQERRDNAKLRHSLEDVRKERTELRAGLERVAAAIIGDPYDAQIRHYDVLVRDVVAQATTQRKNNDELQKCFDGAVKRAEQAEDDRARLRTNLEEVRVERSSLRMGFDLLGTTLYGHPTKYPYQIPIAEICAEISRLREGKVSEPMVTSRWWAWRHEAHKFNLFDVRLFSVASLIDDYVPGNFEPPTTQLRFWEDHFNHYRTANALIQNLPQGATNAP